MAKKLDPTKGQHKILHDYANEYRSPQQLIEALDDARKEFVNSNYHTGLFEKTQKIIREWAKDRSIPMGATLKEREALEAQMYRDRLAEIEATLAGSLKGEAKGEVPQWLRDLGKSSE